MNDITAKWGKKQTLIGPRLMIPYYEISKWKNHNGVLEKVRHKRHAIFLPADLQVQADVKNETRYRGLFDIPVYQTELQINGHFVSPNFQRWDIDPKLILWNEAQLLVAVSDAQAIQKKFYVRWNQGQYAFEPGLGHVYPNDSGFHIPKLPLASDSNPPSEQYNFEIDLTLNGSQGLYIAPMGEDSHIRITSDWPDPSFKGYKLPNQRKITDKGFEASWQTSYISRHYPQQWLNQDIDNAKLTQSLIGVEFLSPVDNYRMTERSLKYVMLFLLLTFTAIWLMEVMTQLRVHLLQYLFIGLGMCLFYLLLLAFSEHVGFLLAYIIASFAVIAMTTLYSKSVLKTYRRAGLIGVGISALYLYLFSLLQEQNYSLLFGSIGVFSVLALIMYVTRHIDWYNLGKQSD